jgi:hypothetical protein
MEENELYEPVRRFLRLFGYRAVVTHEKGNVSIWIGDILPYKEYIEPDVVGVTRSWIDSVCVEAKAKLVGENLFEVVGKCAIWQAIVRKVYLAIPESRSLKTDGLKTLGMGLLTVDEGGEVRELLEPSTQGIAQDVVKSQEFFNQGLRGVMLEHGVLDIDSANATLTPQGWRVPFAMKNVGSRNIMVESILMNGNPCQAYNCEIDVEHRLVTELLPHRTKEVLTLRESKLPFDLAPKSECTVTMMIPKDTKIPENRWMQIDAAVDEEGIEKGFSVYLQP